MEQTLVERDVIFVKRLSLYRIQKGDIGTKSAPVNDRPALKHILMYRGGMCDWKETTISNPKNPGAMAQFH
ncbi:hypothetical protein DNTS_029583, partial [Danionella cerebrum]